MQFSLTKPFVALFLAMGFLVLTPEARAIPGLRDFWHFTCAPNGVNKRLLASTRSRANQGGVKGVIGKLQVACVESALEVEQHLARLQKFQEKGGQGALPQLDQRRSTAMIKSAVRGLEAAYKRKKTAEVVYHYGVALALTQDAWAVNRLDEVKREFKASPLSGDAALALGEFYFDSQAFDKAIEQYRDALKAKKPQIQAYARYKLAWIQYINGMQSRNAGLQRQAIQQLAQLTQKSAQAKGPVKALSVKAKDDVLAMIVELGDLDAAQKILKSVGASEVYGTLLERMAYTRLSEGNAKAAYDLFGLALKERPMSETAPELAINRAALAGEMNNVPLLIRDLKGILKSYIVPKAPWRKRQSKQTLKSTDARVEAVLFDYATALDRQGRDTQNPAYQKEAEGLYALFLKFFKESKKAYEVQFYHAQLLYLLKEYERSAQTFATMIKANPKGQYTKDSLELMVTAAQYAVDNDKTKYQIPAPGKASKEIKIPAIKQTYVDSLDLFVKFMPKHQSAPDMTYAAASVYYDFGHYKEAVKRYYSFMRRHPTNGFAVTAAIRVLEYYKHQGSPKELEAAKKRIKAIPVLGMAAELKPHLTPAEKPKKKDQKGKKAKPEASDEAPAVASEDDSKTESDSGEEGDAGEGAEAVPAATDEAEAAGEEE